MTVHDVQSFDSIVHVYDRFGELINAPLREYLRESLPSGARAVDLRCGGGYFCEMLRHKYDEVVGIDVSAEMIEFARVTRPGPNIRYQVGDLLKTEPGTQGTFDLVFSAYTFHHLDLRAALGSARALVAPGAKLVVVDIVGERAGLRPSWYHRQAVKTLVGDVVLRRRPPAEAVELYRISRDPGWLSHTMSDRPLSPAAFESVVEEVVPGAEVLDMGRARMVVWTNAR
jgi:SAM-dependent methyltransferase